MATTGSMEYVKLMHRTMDMVALMPGMAPNTTPIVTPAAIQSSTSGRKIVCIPNHNRLITYPPSVRRDIQATC